MRRAAVAGVLLLAACSSANPVAAPPAETGPRIVIADVLSVRIRAPSGAFTTVAPVSPGVRVEGLVWSGDGTRLAWLSVDEASGRTRVVEAPATRDATTRDWGCDPACGAVAFRGGTLVSDGGPPGALLEYSSRRPRPLTPSGLPGTPPLTLLTARDGDLYVGTPDAVQHVDADGTASVVQDTRAVPRDGALSADGTQLAYTVTGTVTGCPATEAVVVVDLTTGQAVPVGPPSTRRPQFVTDLWFDDAGTTYASIVDGPGACGPGPVGTATAQIYRRDSQDWVSTGAVARRGADLGDGRSVLLTGPVSAAPDGVRGAPPGVLTLSDSSGSDQVLARNVTSFSVAKSN